MPEARENGIKGCKKDSTIISAKERRINSRKNDPGSNVGPESFKLLRITKVFIS